MPKIPVAVLAATGTVGQRFVQLLENHPWFDLQAVTGSDRTVGRLYGESVNWVIPGDVPAFARHLPVLPTEPNLNVPLVFSALPTDMAKETEAQFAKAGYIVATNASSHRMTPYVPLLIPEINPNHTELIRRQQEVYGWSGFIVASPNCSTTSAILPLKIWQEAFGLEAVLMTTMQAISGAGYPGVSSMSIMDNIIPHIGGEDSKLENEPQKLLGKVQNGELEMANIRLSAQANRVPVYDGHLVSASVKLGRKVMVEEAIAALTNWQVPEICAELPSVPNPTLIYRSEPDRPQTRLDRDAGKGMAWTVGKVRQCHVLDIRFLSLAHNTLRGAASGNILNAELLVKQGYL